MDNWELKNPPVVESLIAVATAEPTAFDTYDVAEIHSLFKDDFPRAERQQPVVGFDPFLPATPLMATPGMPPSIQFTQTQNDLTRWWFSSEDGRNLIQVQQDFIARNWQRGGFDRAPPKSYRGFEVLLGEFHDVTSSLKNYNLARRREFPNPRMASVNYINAIPLMRSDGTTMRFREALPFINLVDTNLKSGLNLQWIEEIRSLPDAKMLVQASMFALPSETEGGGSTMAIWFQLKFDARWIVGDWEAVPEGARTAHEHMRQRLLDLTSDEVKATWN